ncbi:MAG TPA: hypothetical protein PLX18_06680 [Anaerohalosphaeraceae bacterium]|jgi:hypothetical protein|nr:hypothetical protein [Anaerohalosphaeraceae bacterium]HQG06056.1 hypothetical protein [Anaerohalosphaeraceae bacterium]HQI07529.1 hypothetical protein [Anaerohalosphaeraceae bacterium]HQJ67765.1 hypothetical protein [Anaerohalosphaeraceae bacterium]
MTSPHWQFERKVNLSVLVQLFTLAGLIVGGWVNLQRQLDLVAYDVKVLLDNQEQITARLENLHEKTLSQEYRLRAVETDKRPSSSF